MTAINTGSSLFATHYPHAVYLRQFWTDDWQHQPYLYCDALETHAAPEIDRAQLAWRYGVGLQPGTSQFLQWLRTDLSDWYVKVIIDQGTADPIIWYGLITDEFDRRDGAQVNQDGSRIPSGNQQLVAVGLEALLSRVMIDRSTVKTSAGEVEVGRAIPFNIGQGKTDSRVAIGNASTTDEARGTRIFAEALDSTNAAEWTAPQIIEYLLAYYGPANSAGTQIVPFSINPTGQHDAITWQTPRLDVHGRSLLDIINALIDRRRMASWRILVSENGGVSNDDVLIDVFSLTADPIILPGGSIHPANTDTRVLDFDTAVDIQTATVRTSIAHRFDQILARGERRTGTATFSNADGTLVRDWKSADREDYNAGGTNSDGYSSLDLSKQERRHIEARSADRLERAFRWFKLPDDWDGSAGDGLGSETQNPVCPAYIGLMGPGLITVDFWRPALRILPRLPLLTAHDYTGSKISGDSVTSTTPDGSLPQQRPLLAAFRITTDGEDSADAEQWITGENLATPDDEETGDGGRDWSVSITNQDETAGVILDVSRAGWQHAIAAVEFVAADDADNIEAELDWKTDALITATVEFDDHVEARYPSDADVNAVRDAVRRLIIPVPGARLDYVTPQTVVDVDGGELKRSDGGFLNDDRERLADIARAAWGWYGADRRLLDLEYRQLSGLFRVGLFVASIGANETDEEINTPITSVRWNLLSGTTGIQTSFNSLDLTAFATP